MTIKPNKVLCYMILFGVPKTCKLCIVYDRKTKYYAWSWGFRHFADVEVCILNDQITKPTHLLFYKREFERTMLPKVF